MPEATTQAARPDTGLETWLTEMAGFLSAVRDEAQLGAALRSSAADTSQALRKARDAWSRETERVDQLRVQLSTIHSELQRLEKLVGAMYAALEEEDAWPSGARP
jgi:hypothetical protein